MKNIFKGFLFIAILFLHLALSAAYLKFIPQTVTQPDGKVFHCYASGDEFYNWLHDENGYTIIQDAEDGYYYFAQRTGSKLIPTSHRADLTDPEAAGLEPWINIDATEMISIREKFMREEMKARPELEGYPLSAASGEFDEINNIVVYIRFSNQPEYATDTMYYHNMYNSEEPGYNSMKNYFREVSYGVLDMPSWFYPVPDANHVISYQDENPRKYYMPYNATTNPEGYQGNQRTQREHALLKRAVEYISDQVPESINLDDNNDGFVDNVIFVIKGEPTAWSTLLWPHRWVLYNEEAYINGKRVWDFNFQIESELDSRGNGVLCHETYHTLGAPDLYHYNSSPITAVGRWDVMESNANPPQSMGAYMKYRYGGWISEIPEITECGTYTLNPVTSSENNVFKVASPNSSSEYFVLEYRLREGTFESSLPGSGLLVYRIDSKLDGDGNAQGPPDEVFIFRPNGAPDKNGDLNIAHLSADVGRTVVNDSSLVSTYLQNGTPGGLSIGNIGYIGETITFDVFFESEPIADFEPSVQLITPGCSIDFYDMSACNVDSWEWTFEGGTPATSTDQHPEGIVFENPGNYSVTLKATNAYGSQEITYTGLIEVSESAIPEIEFAVTDTMVCTGKPVQFIDETLVCPESWTWTVFPESYEFVNNSSPNSQHPEIIFLEPGNYSVTLQASNVNGEATATKENYIIAGGVTLPYFEDFESAGLSATGWTTVHPEDGDATWSVQFAPGNGGSFAAGINLYESFNFMEKNQLISPLINLSGLESAALSFDHAYTLTGTDLEYTDSLIVKISVDCGENWTRLLELYEDGTGSLSTTEPLASPFTPGSPEDWCGYYQDSNCYSIDLSPWLNHPNAMIMFETVRILGNNLYIDNVRIDALTSVNDLSKAEDEQVLIYPNPTTGQVTIQLNDNLDQAGIRVFNIHGQVVNQVEQVNNRVNIDLSELPEGLYFIRVSKDGRNLTRKVLVR